MNPSYYSLVFYYNKRMWWLVSATYDAWEVLFYQQIEETYGKWSNDAVFRMESAERWNAVETAEG
ncbi:hypothetical protein CE91St4_16710 [Parabacteroides distasonis]|nr:hypothetical protein CE91St4_16710 [Parabacteroides distasonis]